MFCKYRVLSKDEGISLMLIKQWNLFDRVNPRHEIQAYVTYETMFVEILEQKKIEEMFKERMLETMTNVYMWSLWAPWQNGPYKNQHTEQHKNT